MSKMWFVAGAAVGYVLGARAGREQYDKLVRSARQLWESPTVQEAAGVAREQTARLVDTAKDKVQEKVGTYTHRFDRSVTDAEARINGA
ncbi:YtxH domain-containing protein [Hamadaea tsunoensis]|uniref:YtxH domain-containing protein n=1 Tax=Hamadaea tsunoensis TaxID=53368 RepID=UPI0004232197|nr:YtxH domain-containing protein [Hamadaea tsunoensis]